VRTVLLSVWLVVACAHTGAAPSPAAWALNDSSNDYVIRLVDPGTDADSVSLVDSWDLPHGASGYTAEMARGLVIEVLDATSCGLVLSQQVESDTLIDIDPRGKVEFIAQADPPAMNSPLVHSARCDTTPPPSTTTS
jgi:hypothetical protein